MSKPVLSITYEHIDRWIASIQSMLMGEEFSCVIGILRGGGPVALMASHAIGSPVAFLRYERMSRQVAWDSSIPLPPRGSKVLLCEDISGTGNTLTDCVAYLSGQGLVPRVLTVGFDDKSRFRPDYSIDGRGYFLLFPWERQSYTEGYRERWIETQAGRLAPMEEDHQYDIYGIDLDGILLPDVAPELYAADLDAALSKRDHTAPFADLPALHRIKAIVTGRPEMDRARTLDWLQRHGFAGIELVMRNTGLHDDSPQQVADHKALASLRLGCTHFVESDPVQAIFIAAAAPLLRVIWWDAVLKNAKLIGAASVASFNLCA